jgi:hypothetical protein
MCPYMQEPFPHHGEPFGIRLAHPLLTTYTNAPHGAPGLPRPRGPARGVLRKWVFVAAGDVPA